MLLDQTTDELRQHLPALFRCTRHADGVVLVVTPFVMPDGSMVTVFVDETSDRPRVTDYGDTLGMLPMMAPRCEELPHIPRLAEEAARVPGVALENGELVADVRDNDNLADLIVAVAQASLRVSCLVYACRDPNERDLYWELGKLLRDAGTHFDRSVPCTGASGREWTVSYAVKCEDATALITILTGGTPVQSKAVADHAAAVIDDLRLAATGSPKFVVLFDDVGGDWPDDAIERLAGISEAVPWSKRADLIRALAREPAAVG